jgi:hypothetical protein
VVWDLTIPKPVGEVLHSTRDEVAPPSSECPLSFEPLYAQTEQAHAAVRLPIVMSRTTDSADARSVRIHITAEGRSVLAQVRAERGATIDQHLARLDNADRRTLAEAVRIMRGLLDDAQRCRRFQPTTSTDT